MTDSPTEQPTGKRERLVATARASGSTSKGSRRRRSPTSPQAADVPVGNVYYYFKTKDELVDAAIDGHASQVRVAARPRSTRHPTPQARLKALIRELHRASAELAADYGCPLGSLCSELDKRADSLARTCSELLRLPVDWAEQQFRLMGRRNARDLAVALIASYEGIALLTNTFRDPRLMNREGRRLERWIDSLA